MSEMNRRSALVFGGSGAVGSEVVRGLAAAGIDTVFTYHRNREAASALTRDCAARGEAIDLRESGAIRTLVQRLSGIRAPDLFIHCAAVTRNAPLAALSDEDWDTAQSVNCRSAFIACQSLAPHFAEKGQSDIVLVGAMDRAQSLPMPIPFAASQGTLAAMTVALAKELGPGGTRVNMVALGVLDGGLARDLSPRHLADYKTFSAFRRTGTPAEAAKAILWLALENKYMSGKVLPVNGGI